MAAAETRTLRLPDSWDVIRWTGRNLFFGGVQAVELEHGRNIHGGRRSTARRGRGGRRVIRIRRAEPADAVSLVELAEAVGGEEGRWILATDTWRSVSEERRYLKTVLRHPDATVIVALDGEHVVGRLSLSRDPHPASHHVADLGLMVAESHRRRGIGKRLLEEAVTWARGVGIAKLELHVFPWNESALRLYESFGFEREGYRKRHYVRGDELVDAILMAMEVPTDDARDRS